MAEVAHRVARQGFSVCLPNPRGIGQSAGSAPILDLQAEQDPFAPFVTAHDLAKELGAERVQVLRIQNASHALIAEQPAAVTDAIIQFMLDLQRNGLSRQADSLGRPFSTWGRRRHYGQRDCCQTGPRVGSADCDRQATSQVRFSAPWQVWRCSTFLTRAARHL